MRRPQNKSRTSDTNIRCKQHVLAQVDLAHDVNEHVSCCWLSEVVYVFFILFLGLFNLRGNDIPYNPFFYSYTLLTMDHIW